MTEQQWLECTDPDDMLLFLGDKPSNRQLRLFGCACLRRVWRVLPEDKHRRAIEISERFADGLITPEDLEAARRAAWGTYHGSGDIIADHGALIAGRLCLGNVSIFGVDGAAAIAAEACADSAIGWSALYRQERAAQSHLLRDLFSNPFRPVLLDPAWLNPAVASLARAAYAERALPSGYLDPARLAVLADALEEAGCDHAEILMHLRGPESHTRGCWVLDLIRGEG